MRDEGESGDIDVVVVVVAVVADEYDLEARAPLTALCVLEPEGIPGCLCERYDDGAHRAIPAVRFGDRRSWQACA